jgi:fido (protein-threonine AMPylation protein)
MPVEWTGDGTPADGLRIERNLALLLTDLALEAPTRALPTIGMARTWHRRIFDGVAPPVAYFAGGIRDSDPMEPELVDYEVEVRGRIGVARGVAAAAVWNELAAFRKTLREQVAEADQLYPIATSGNLVVPGDRVIELCAWSHGEWVRIHPFVNGNGRTARIWANWVALRYGLPAFIRLRPRPAGDTYASAAERSMSGDHRYMEIELTRQLSAYLASGGTS